MIGIGDKAPDCKLKGIIKGEEKVFDLRPSQPRWLVVFFYPKDFTFVCPTEIKAFNKIHKEFLQSDAIVLGISADTVDTHKDWAEELGGLNYALLSDTDLEASKRFGVLNENEKLAHRATFIISPEGLVQYAVAYQSNVGRSVEESLRVLKALQTKKMCPAGWLPGDATIDP